MTPSHAWNSQCGLLRAFGKKELFSERDHCTPIQTAAVTGSVQSLNGSREGVGIVSPQLPSWQFALNHTALASDFPSGPSQFYHRYLEHVGKWSSGSVCLLLFMSTNLKVFSGRAVWYQTHPSPFPLTALSEVREVWKGGALALILWGSVIPLIRASHKLWFSMCNATALGRKTMLIVKVCEFS